MSALPVRKISETILDFGSPLLEQFDEDTPLEVLQATLELVVMVWNAHVTAMPRWGQPRFLAELQQRINTPGVPQEMAETIDLLAKRRDLVRFKGDARAVGEWHVESGPDGWRLRCDARAPAEG